MTAGPVRFACQHCRAFVDALSTDEGKVINCPVCGKPTAVRPPFWHAAGPSGHPGVPMALQSQPPDPARVESHIPWLGWLNILCAGVDLIGIVALGVVAGLCFAEVITEQDLDGMPPAVLGVILACMGLPSLASAIVHLAAGVKLLRRRASAYGWTIASAVIGLLGFMFLGFLAIPALGVGVYSLVMVLNRDMKALLGVGQPVLSTGYTVQTGTVQTGAPQPWTGSPPVPPGGDAPPPPPPPPPF